MVATFQAAVLAPIVKPVTFKKPFKGNKKKPFLDYANDILIEGGQETELCKSLIVAIKSGDYSLIFPKPFIIDQRFATPKVLYNTIKEDANFQLVGRFSYFQNELEIINRDEKLIILIANK